MDKRYQVFISSTFADLHEERRRVMQTILELDCFPAGMEFFPAADEEQWEFIKRVIDDCDYYLLVIGGRYGSLTPEGISYTEKEYDYALECGLRVLAFLHERPDEIPAGKSELNADARTKLDAFRKRVAQGRLVRFWTRGEELPGLVALSLSKTIKAYPAVGWARATGMPSAKALGEANELRRRVSELEMKLEQARRQLAATATATIPDFSGGEPIKYDEPSSLVVDQTHHDGYTSITAAIQAARPGDRILVRPGYYQEGLIIDKPLEIVGDGELSQIVVHAVDRATLLFRTTLGRVSNVTFRQSGGRHYGIKILQGRLELDGCDVSSNSLACVAIMNDADPQLRYNRIHDGRQCGIIVGGNGRGTIEDNDIVGNGISGIMISGNAKPTLRRNRINRNSYRGVWIKGEGGGFFENNDLRENSGGPWDVTTSGTVKQRDNLDE